MLGTWFKYSFFIGCFIALGIGARAQVGTVLGKVTENKKNASLPGASIQLIDVSKKENKFYEASNYDGGFIIKNVPYGNYQLKITYVGHEEWNRKITIEKSKVDLGRITLLAKTKLLSAVNITKEASSAIQKGDTTQFNASSYKTNPDANAENLLEKMPGMVMTEGKLQAQGEDVKEVLVDGQPFFGDDPNAALKNIPAEIIKKIQVFDKQSEQSQFTGFDDGNTTKTINIITKKEYKNGTFGKAFAGYGYDNKYAVGLVANHFNGDQRITLLGQFNNINQLNFSTGDLAGIMSSSSNGRGRRGGGRKRPDGSSGSYIDDFLIGEQLGITNTNAIGLNYSDKLSERLSLTASYFFNETKNIANTITVQDFYATNSVGQQYNETEEAETKNTNHRINLRFKYDLDRKNSFIFQPKFSFQSNSGFSNLNGQTALNNELLNTTANNFSSDISAWNFSNLLLWRHRFEKRGRSLSINFQQNITGNTAKSLLQAQNNYYSTQTYDTLDQTATLDKFEQTYSSRIIYTEPITNGINLMLGYSPSISINSSDKETFNMDNASETYSSFDSTLSNVSESLYQNHKGEVGLRMNTGKSRFMINAGVQYASLQSQQSLPENAEVNSTFTNVLPNLMWRYNINHNKKLMLFYRTSTTAPSILQLQELVDNSNPLQLTMGNSNLNQQYNHNLHAKYTITNPSKNSMFFAMLKGSLINNYIGQNTVIAERNMITANGVELTPGAQLAQYQNMDGYYSLSAFSTYGAPVKSLKSNLNINLSVGLTHTPGIINDVLNTVDAANIGLGAVLSSNISERVDFTIGTTSSINQSINSLSPDFNSEFFNQTTKVKFYYNFLKNLTFRTEVQHQFFNGFTDDFTTNYFLWNASIGAKLFKDQRGEILLSVYDILNQNNSVNRMITESYIQDTQTEVLNRYAMLTFKYNFKKFKTK